MLWGKLEFARELSRQLVEIASIKKLARSHPEILERVERLEASHLHLLRKLSDGSGDLHEKRRRVSRRRVRARKGERLFREAMSRYLKCLWQTGSKIAIEGARQSGTALSKTCLQVRRKSLPRLNQTCAVCGRVLISSVLAGEAVIVRKKEWYHGRCAEKGAGYKKPGHLN